MAMAMNRQYSTLPHLAPDIEVARAAKLLPIGEVARAAGFRDDEIEPYGSTKAKINDRAFQRLAGAPDGKLILVTAMTATRAGEGKTVTSIGLAEALGKLGVRHMLALRQPSLGPTFGIKGGAAGGGRAQVMPMDEINMHFTGDIHAVTSAHNLLAAVLDNSIYHGNPLRIDPERVAWRRAMDLCDRQLRHIELGMGDKADGFPHKSGFDITAASEIMTTLALADDLRDLQERLGRIVVAYTREDQPVFARKLNVVGSLVALLKDAIQPNLVQTIENTPALIHCGPFGNIAHGCNSVRATRLALKLADYVVTEAGFAADLGAEKFFDIKARLAGLRPAAAVMVVTCRALKMHGGVDYENLKAENVEAVRRGLANVRVHAENLLKFDVPVIVAINRFPQDTPAELDTVFEFCEAQGLPAALSEVAARGGAGGIDLARRVIEAIEANGAHGRPLKTLYPLDAPVKAKIATVAREIYRTDGIDYTAEAEHQIDRLERLGLARLPICMAKTQLSLSDNPKLLGAPTGWRLKVREVRVSNGAGFIVVVTGSVLLMPGMPEHPATEKITVDEAGNIHGLF